MTDEELRDALDGLYAYDKGSVDSGIHDEDLRARCIKAMDGRRGNTEAVWRTWLARFTRDMWLSDESIGQGYGMEDVVHFAEWLEDQMDTPLPG